MRDAGFWLVMLLAVLLLAVGAGCKVYRFKECRSVGHGLIYCVDQLVR